MSILKLARMGHPVLRQLAEAVADPTAPDIAALVDDMIETMEDAGGTGLAAPQVHVSLRVIVFRVKPERVTAMLGDGPVDLTVLVNPEWEALDEEMNLDWEGCLSMPGLRGAVPRYSRLRYGGYDLAGNWIERQVAGFHARVIQHEVDHLDGVLYPERMDDLSLLSYFEEWQRYPIDLVAYAAEQEQAQQQEQAI
jgi:peptide deformylase